MGGSGQRLKKVGKECMFVGKGVISLGKENLMICKKPVANLSILFRSAGVTP